jgi:pimeloyl-ACP methyl ester carboxylesterase
MSSIVIVHGAGSGGWLWKSVRRLLSVHNHEVYTPTLTGVGERAHLSNPEVSLTTHIDDIANVLCYEDLHDVVLIGHSYGGMVIAGVADREPERLSKLIYVDAFVPEDGQCLLNFVPPQVRAAFEQQVQSLGTGWQVPPMPYTSLGKSGVNAMSEAEAQVLLQKRVAQPFKTYTEPVHLTSDKAASLPRSYIHCTDKPADDVFAHFADQARNDPRWRCEVLPTGHFPMLTMPHELTDLLAQLS